MQTNQTLLCNVPKIIVALICKFATIVINYPASKTMKNAITWKYIFRRKLTFLSKLDLSEAIN